MYDRSGRLISKGDREERLEGIVFTSTPAIRGILEFVGMHFHWGISNECSHVDSRLPFNIATLAR